MPIGAIIGAGATIAGGLMENAANKKIAAQNLAHQKEFAQSGIQWKVEDAKKAGIHPLYALGAQTHSFAPNNIGADFSFLGQAGQNIGRAIDATRSNEGKVTAFQQTAQALQLDSLKLDNDIKRAQLASAVATVRSGGSAPGLPTPATRWLLDGQGDTPSVDGPTIKLETRRDVSDPAAPHAVAGAGPDVTFARTAFGGYAPLIPPELAESLESDTLGRWQWLLRNRIAPIFGAGERPPIPLEGKYGLYYDPIVGEWRRYPKFKPMRIHRGVRGLREMYGIRR